MVYTIFTKNGNLMSLLFTWI
uniref:Uncharacterized protein n=1 Tax=Arundo donax TaxID=35708 RepID=A0A0A9FSC4_ARUDO